MPFSSGNPLQNLIYAVILLALIGLFAKMLIYFTQQFLDKKKDGENFVWKNDKDFDRLVLKKAEMIKLNQNLQKKNSEKTIARNGVKSFLFAEDWLFKLREQNKEQAEEGILLKKFIRLYNEIQWGGGEVFYSLYREVSNDFPYTMTQEDLVKAFKELSHGEFYLNRNQNALFLETSDAVPRFFDSIKIVAIMPFLAKEIREREGGVIDKIKQNYHVSAELAARSLSMNLLHAFSGQKNKLSDFLENDFPAFDWYKIPTHAREDHLRDLCIKGEQVRFSHRQSLALGSGMALERLRPFLPLIDKEKTETDLEFAFRLLGVTPHDSDEHIKKAFNHMALFYHPDRLNTEDKKGIDAKYVLLANQNFSTINEAYQRIKKARG